MSAIGNEICELLVDLGFITSEQVSDALTEQEKSGERITVVLSRLGLVSERQLKDALELQFGVNYINLSSNRPEDEIVRLVSEDIARKFRFVPVALQGDQYSVAMVDPDDLIAADAIRTNLGSENFKKLVCTAVDFEYLLHITYVEPPEVLEESSDNGSESSVEDQTVDSKPLAASEVKSLFDSDDDDFELGSDQSEVPNETPPLDESMIETGDNAPVKDVKNLKKSFGKLFGDDDDDLFEDTEARLEAHSVKDEVSDIISSLESQAVGSVAGTGDFIDSPESQKETLANLQELSKDPVNELIQQDKISGPALSLFGDEDEDEFESKKKHLQLLLYLLMMTTTILNYLR